VFPTPRHSRGLRLHGEYQGSGLTEPRYIARRGDGQVVQLSRLLYLVAGAADGVRDTEAISHRVSGEYGREVSEGNVFFLIDEKLIPLGIIVPWGQECDEVEAPRTDLLLALKGHKVLFDEPRVGVIARVLAWLHHPLIVAMVLLAAVAMDVWLFGFHGAITPVLAVLDQPVLMLAVFALTVASLFFHEFGHASACRYSGACPGCIGCGLFLIWPSMYTDVTDVYRIGRGGRIRTDLGGIYFNIVFMLLLLGSYALTGQTFLLSAIYVGHFEVLEQLMPAVRLDGYYILGDLAGVPDLYGKIGPILRSAIPGRPVAPEVAGLRRSARAIVTAWVVTMVPLLAADLGYALWNLPRILSTGAKSLAQQVTGTGEALAHGQIMAGLAGLVGSLMLVFPLVGTAYLSVRMTGRLVRAARRSTAQRPRLRIALSVSAVVLVGALGTAWVAGLTPKPIPAQPPLVPALQPGVPTLVPASGIFPAAGTKPTPSASVPGPGSVPSGTQSPYIVATGTASGAHPSMTASPAVPVPSTSGAGLASASAPSPSAAPTTSAPPPVSESPTPPPSPSAPGPSASGT
jgi:putative peptide zinc metalloprotease protein